MRKAFAIFAFFPLFVSAITLEDAIKVWENAYKQGYEDCQNRNTEVYLWKGYYIVITSPIPDYLAGLFKFVAKKDFPSNYIGYKRGNTLYLLYAQSLSEARFLKEKYDKELKKIEDMFNVNTYIEKVP